MNFMNTNTHGSKQMGFIKEKKYEVLHRHAGAGSLKSGLAAGFNILIYFCFLG